MKNIGAKLRKAREEKGLSIEDAVRETNIAKKYIIAFEAEDFSQFPAEAYVLGFLKNYGEYLGLDTKELVNQYKVLKIQEQPVPVHELLTKPSALPRVIMTCVIALVIILIGGGALFLILNNTGQDYTERAIAREPIEYKFVGGLLEHRFFIGDSVSIPLEEGSFKIELSNLGDLVTLSSPRGNIILGLNQDAVVDVDEDSVAELRIQAADYAQNNAEMGALLRFDMSMAITQAADGAGIVEAGTETAPIMPAAAQTDSQTIFNAAQPYPFTLQLAFQGYCMFRWEVLREGNRQNRGEKYFSRGEEFNIQAQNGIRLWMGNAGVVKLKAVGGGRTVPLEAGAGVVVADVLWRRGEDGRYNLALSRLEN